MTALRMVGLLSVSALLALRSRSSAQAPLEKTTTAWTLKWDADWVTAVSFVGPKRLAAGNTLGDILVWELPEKTGGPAPMPVRRLAGHSNTINRLIATPDQRWLLSASNDRTVGCWDLQAEPAEMGVVVLNARAIADAEAKKKRTPPAVEAKVRVQKADKVLTGHKDWVLGMSLTADGNLLVT